MKISGLQIFWLIISALLGNLLLLSISPTTKIALQDAWISFIFAGVFGLLIILIAAKVNSLAPTTMFYDLTKKIVGKWLGTAILINYLISWFIVLGILLAEFAVFTITILLPETPVWVTLLTMLLLVVYLTYIGGIEGIGRCSEVFGPIIILGVIALLLLSVQNIEFKRILPIYADSGFFSILKGSIYPFSILGEVIFLLVLFPFINQPKMGAIKAAWGLAVISILTMTIVLSTIMTFGSEITAKLQYPTFDVIRYINIMNFIQNLEIIAVLVWILSIFIKISVYFFITSYSTAQFLKLKDWRKTIWFVAVFSFVTGTVFNKLNIEGLDYLEKYWIPVVMPINMVGIPLLLLTVGSIRKNREKTTKKQGNIP